MGLTCGVLRSIYVLVSVPKIGLVSLTSKHSLLYITTLLQTGAFIYLTYWD